MAKFRCIGNPIVVVEFTAEHDIENMRKHPQYEEVTEEVKEDKKAKKKDADKEA